MDGKKRGRGGVRGCWRMCVQVWDMARWITLPSRQFITVTERERGKERLGREERKEGKEKTGKLRGRKGKGYPVEEKE